MQKVLEEYDYVSKALSNNRGLTFRIRLIGCLFSSSPKMAHINNNYDFIELWFNEVTRHNATYPQKRPLNYEELKAKLMKIMSSNSELKILFMVKVLIGCVFFRRQLHPADLGRV